MRGLSVATRGVLAQQQGIGLATRGILDLAREEAVGPLIFELPGRFDITLGWLNQRISELGAAGRAFATNSAVTTYWDRVTGKVGTGMGQAMPLRLSIIDLQDKLIKLGGDLRSKS